MEAANAAYEQGSWNNAIEDYTKLIDNGYSSIALYNNLGSSHYKSGDIPNAILYFEKGLKLDPFDKSFCHQIWAQILGHHEKDHSRHLHTLQYNS